MPAARNATSQSPLALRIVLLHAVVGDEHEGAVVDHAALLERVEDRAQPTVAVADRRRGHLRVRPAFVHRGVGERELHHMKRGSG